MKSLVYNEFIRCEVCGCITRIRLQVGWLDEHPIAVTCGKCGISLKGKVKIGQDTLGLKFEFENAERVNAAPTTIPDYVVECSGEFTTIKMCDGWCLQENFITPFIRYQQKSGDFDNIMFSQNRIGKNGKMIKIYKFRSMVPNAEKILEDLMKKDPKIKEEYLTNKKLVNDPRITPVGKFLRKTSLDEWPQFINVLKGEMSLIGPRPYLPREKEDMGQYYSSIIKCKPGVTGMWQANGRSDVGFDYRCKLDDYYYHNWSVWLDFTILYKTIKSVVYGKGSL